tara:strand:+ start:2150 stop:2491 length:342 start_codon:yes stop_codon:yes gene_type:complete
MAIVFTSTASTGVATVTGSKVVVPIAVPDNCYSIVFQNDDATDTILVAQGTAGAGAIPLIGSIHVRPNTSFVWDCGTKSERVDDLTAAGSLLVFDSTANNIPVYVTYLCGNKA